MGIVLYGHATLSGETAVKRDTTLASQINGANYSRDLSAQGSSESNLPPFLVKWNPGLDRHICGRLQSSVEKWSQKIFLWALCRLTGALFRLQVSVRVNPYNYWWKITTVTSVIFSLTWALFRLTGEPLQLLEANRCLFSGIWPDMRAI